MGPLGTGGRPWRGAEPGSELMSGAGLVFPELTDVAERSGGEYGGTGSVLFTVEWYEGASEAAGLSELVPCGR